MTDLNEFVAWVSKKSSRCCKIEIQRNFLLGDMEQPVETKIWVYDIAIDASQNVQSVSEINLEATKEQREREEYEKLKAKFGGT